AMLGKKKVEPFVVPTLAEADPETYGALIAKRAELQVKAGEARKAEKAAERELATDTRQDLRPAVAELLADGATSKPNKRQALTAAKAHASDVEAALSVIEQRIRDAKTVAVRAAIALVRPEFDRRMRSLCDALKLVD